MATNGENPARRDIEELNRFRELFHGRFSVEEAAFLLGRYDGDAKQAAAFALTAEPSEIRRLFQEDEASWKTVECIRKSNPILIQVKRGYIETSARLFACSPCDRVWWRRTPDRKPVSKCNLCHRRYDAVPRDKEWGWALFKCEHCQHEFGGYCGMWMSSPCYKCGHPVMPYCIQPPTNNRRRRTQNRHCCNAPNCCGRRGLSGIINPGGPMIEECVHPTTRRAEGKPLVVVPSEDHDSTGSTVDTCLPQYDLLQGQEIVIPMPTIREESRRDE